MRTFAAHILLVTGFIPLLAQETRAQTVLFSDDFESGLGNWTVTGLWNLETETDQCGTSAAPFPSAATCVWYGIEGQCTYDTPGSANSGSLTLSTPLTLPAPGPAAFLHCWTSQRTEPCGEPGYDFVVVEVSINGGASWAGLGTSCNAGANVPPQWLPRTFDLGPYLGQTILVRFRFDTLDELFNQYRGYSIDDVQIRIEAGSPYCTHYCPCVGDQTYAIFPTYKGNRGCPNSRLERGELAASGFPSVSADNVVLIASDLPPGSTALFLQGSSATQGYIFGDGRFCLRGSIVPLAVKRAANGTAAFPGPGDPSLALSGSLPTGGATVGYQVLYRDPADFCLVRELNATSGYRVQWTP